MTSSPRATPHPGQSDASPIDMPRRQDAPRTGRILARTLAMSWFMIIFTVGVFTVATIPSQRRRLIEEMHQRAQVVQSSTAQVLEDAIVLDDYSVVVEHCINIVSQNPSLRYVVITPKDGPSLIHLQAGWRQEDYGGMWKPEKTQQTLQGRIMNNPLGEGELFHVSYPFEYVGLEWGWIHLGLSTDKFHADSRLLYKRSGLSALAAISMGFLLSLYFARRLSVPILKLEHFARNVASGDLSHRIDIRTGDEIEQLGKAFNFMVNQLQQANREREQAQKNLIDTARQAGMAEMVSNVLHNVGNVLNSVGVTTSSMHQRLVKSKTDSLVLLSDMIQDQGPLLTEYLATDPRGRKVPSYLNSLANHLAEEQQRMRRDIIALESHIQHVRDIIHLQQDYSRTRGLTESVGMADIIEDALRFNNEQNIKYGISIQKTYANLPQCLVDRHRLLQILINLISNARQALIEGDNHPKVIRVVLERHSEDRIRITVSDDGIGISPENLTRIFQHGFTTRKEGHGFGLHSSAISARELSGTLTAASDGIGNGASFVIDLPYRPVKEPHADS